MPPTRNDLNPALVGRQRACDPSTRYAVPWSILAKAPFKASVDLFAFSEGNDGSVSTPVSSSQSGNDADSSDVLPPYRYAQFELERG